MVLVWGLQPSHTPKDSRSTGLETKSLVDATYRGTIGQIPPLRGVRVTSRRDQEGVEETSENNQMEWTRRVEGFHTTKDSSR